MERSQHKVPEEALKVCECVNVPLCERQHLLNVSQLSIRFVVLLIVAVVDRVWEVCVCV